MNEIGIDIADRTPEYVDDLELLEQSRCLGIIGCSITTFNPASHGVESRNWDLTNPDGQYMETVREVREEIKTRLKTLLDEVERTVENECLGSDSTTGFVGTIRDALSA